MALGTPSWLNLEFMEGILRRSECDNSIQVIDIFTKPATSKGDNYTSDMLRVTIEFSRKKGSRTVTEKKNVIIKIAPNEEGMKKDMIEKSQIFHVEISMMMNTLEKMNNYLKGKHRFNGRALYVQNENPALLVIEDLATLGFRMANRHAGLDLQHSLLALRGLAKFHATSVAVCEKEPKQKQMYPKGMFHDSHPKELRVYFDDSCKCFAKELANWPELEKRYSEKFLDFASRIYQKGIEAYTVKEDEFNVICHGDFWVNNMLFKYDDNGEPIDHMFVDFQLGCYASPVCDLHYFLATSVSAEIFENKKDMLIDEYYTTLTNTMKEIGCQTSPPTKEKLMESMKKRTVLEMIASISVLPIVLLEKHLATDFEELMNATTEFNNPGYRNEAYRKIMCKRIPYYEQLGLLD